LRKKDRSVLYNNIRAAAESGWDFSSRWFEDEISLSKCIATEIIPVDLNCLLYFYERKLSEMYSMKNMKLKSEKYLIKSIQRRDLINRIFWDKDRYFYFDYNLKNKKTTRTFSLAACFPLFFEIADSERAASVANTIERKFLKPGGVITTLNHTGQQWDAPNGWAPLQHITINGLRNYGFNNLANEIKSRWLRLNTNVFDRTKKMFEKYNVEDISLSAGGGEYPLQDGFGWTNGVAIALLKKDS
jgi:alpha,alpha-trehalase